MRLLIATMLLALASCSGFAPGDNQGAADPPDLERAAIERGLVRDPGDSDVTGLYASDTDRVCVVRQGGGYRIGVAVDYGDGLSCAGSGKAARSGGTLSIELKGKGGATCAFDAKFDGDRLIFPATLPDGCARLCGPRTSFASLSVERMSESEAEAIAMRTADGTRLCGS